MKNSHYYIKRIILICYMIISGVILFSQAPSNDCGENYLEINQCGVSFSVTQSEMGNATEDVGCSVGGSCPITYVNGQGYENFDCNDNTGNSSGDDFNGSVENSLWWGFVPNESCDYTVSINITNCCCKDKGSSNSAQYQIFSSDSPLPSGTITNSYAYQTGVTGSFTETISVNQGETIYIMLDGLNGSDCDIDVSIQPTSNCSGCILALSNEVELFKVRKEINKAIINWSSDDVNLIVERSSNGTDWVYLSGFISNTSNSDYTLVDRELTKGYNYYRLISDGIQKSRIKVIHNNVLPVKVKKSFDIFGREIKDTKNYNGVIIDLKEDYSAEKRIN